MNARWTTTSAPLTRSSTSSRLVMSPCRYSVLRSPIACGSNGRRAIPTTRLTSRVRSIARRNGLPISPVGPVTATVRVPPLPAGRTPRGWGIAAGPYSVVAGLAGEHDARGLAADDDLRLDRHDLLRARVLDELGGGREAPELLERLDRREDEEDVAVGV